MREPLMNSIFSEGLFNFLNQEINFVNDDLQLPEGEIYLDNTYQSLFNYLYKKAELTYSVGALAGEMQPHVEACIDAFLSFRQHATGAIVFVKEVDEYMQALALLSWAITLPISQDRFEQLVAAIDAEGQRDALLDLLIAKRLPQRSLSPTLYFAKLYQPLLDAATSRAPQQMARFLAQWYKTCLKKTSSYDIHKLGDDSSFTGYWAWEVAGLTYALDIDDTSYQAMAYYPRDLVAFARQS